MSAQQPPLRLREAPVNSREAMLQILQVVQRIEILAMGYEALLAELHGTAIDRDETLEWCGLLIEQSELAIEMLRDATDSANAGTAKKGGAG